MICRNCGAEIADKALICYRCGTATTDAKYKPAAPRRQSSPAALIVTVIAIALLAIVALVLSRTGGGQSKVSTGVVVAVAVVVVSLRAWARRRR